MPSAYQSRPYDDRYSTARMSDLMREAGAVQAQGIQERGQMAAQTWGRMGDLIGGAISAGVQAHRQTKAQQEADKAKAEQQRIADAVKGALDPATGRLDFGAAAKAIGQIDPLKAEEFWAKADQQQRVQAEKEAAQAEEVAKGLGAVLLTAQQDKSKATSAYATWRADALKRKLIEPDEFPEEYDEGVVQQQALFKYLPADAVFKQLFAAKNAPQRSSKVVEGKIIDDQTGAVIYAGDNKPEGQVVETVDAKGNPIRKFVTRDELAKGVPVYKAPKGDGDGDRLTKAQRNAAITSRRNEIQAVDRLLADGKIGQDEYSRMRYDIDLDYYNKTGENKPAPPLTVERGPQNTASRGRRGLAEMTPEELQAAGGEPTMRDLLTPPARPANVQAPLGAAPASAASAPQAPAAPAKGGVSVTMPAADGSVTITLPNGKQYRAKSLEQAKQFLGARGYVLK